MRNVVIVSVAQTEHKGEARDAFYELAFRAAKAALDEVGLDRTSIDTVITAGWDEVDGRTIAGMYLEPASGGYLKETSKVAEDAIFSAAYAYMRIASGHFDTALVVGHGHKESDFQQVSHFCFDPPFHRPLGLCALLTFAIQATRYMHEFGVSEEDAAQVVVKNRKNALNNPYAHLRKEVTVEEVLKSPVVSWPLKELDIPPVSVGACAIIMAAEEVARRITDEYVAIKGLGWASSSYYLGSTDLARIPSAEVAARRAYKMAGIEDPVKEVDVAEIHEVTSFHELMTYEALGFAKPGEGPKLLKEGITYMDGELPVNPSGGALSTSLYAGTGLVRLAEAALQVMGKAGKRQVPDVETALAHGVSAITGAASRADCVFVVGR